jgi:hypothetical protein
MALLRFLIITIGILYLVRLLARIFLPMLFQSVVNKAQQQAQQQAGQQQRRQQSRRPEGSLHVDFIPPKDREAKAADKAGDFIDYEEVK